MHMHETAKGRKKGEKDRKERKQRTKKIPNKQRRQKRDIRCKMFESEEGSHHIFSTEKKKDLSV